MTLPQPEHQTGPMTADPVNRGPEPSDLPPAGPQRIAVVRQNELVSHVVMRDGRRLS